MHDLRDRFGLAVGNGAILFGAVADWVTHHGMLAFSIITMSTGLAISAWTATMKTIDWLESRAALGKWPFRRVPSGAKSDEDR